MDQINPKEGSRMSQRTCSAGKGGRSHACTLIDPDKGKSKSRWELFDGIRPGDQLVSRQLDRGF